MQKKFLILAILLLLNHLNYAAVNVEKQAGGFPSSAKILELSPQVQALFKEDASRRPNPLLQLFRSRQKKNRKLVAALLAFPLPFGIVGLHRIYLGCAPYVPVVYIATAGGAFGILPFIDFCVLLLDKDVDRYLNNDKVFMWAN